MVLTNIFIQALIKFLDSPCSSKPTGVMIAVPSYSAYTAIISSAHAFPVCPYYMINYRFLGNQS